MAHRVLRISSFLSIYNILVNALNILLLLFFLISSCTKPIATSKRVAVTQRVELKFQGLKERQQHEYMFYILLLIRMIVPCYSTSWICQYVIIVIRIALMQPE